MEIASGDVPIKYFQRRLLSGLLSLLLAFVLSVMVVLLVAPERMRLGAVILIVPLAVGLALVRNFQNQPRCPYCRATVEYDKAADSHWRIKFPYGFAIACHVCHADLTSPYQG